MRVRVSDRAYVQQRLDQIGVDRAAVPEVFQAIDRVEKNRPAAEEMLHLAVGRTQADEILAFVLGARDASAAVVPEDAPLAAVFAALDSLGFRDWVDFDPTIVRGLAYYTGTVFELFDAKRSLRAICGGGRYDNLLEQVGGHGLPALGFGMGDVVLGELLKDRGLHPAMPPSIDAFVASVTADDVPDVLRTARELRDAGVRVEYALGHNAVGKQLNLANARGARYAVVIGPDDRAAGSVQLKDLARQSQETVRRAALVSRLSSLLSGASHG